MGRGRSLDTDELDVCDQVFAGTLPRTFLASKVTVMESLGLGGRPFTSRDFGLGRYEIYLGPKAFDPMQRTQPGLRGYLIHEMTHVWQAETGWGIGAVWLSSIKCQIQRQGNAYLYGEGNLGKKDWDDFGKEEQAQIVQDWYENGLKSSDPRFPYIRNNVRKGRAGFVSDPSGTTA